MKKTEKYLPIGTVIMLKGGTKRIMITGFKAIVKGKEEKVWDYCGCLYPEGCLAGKRVCLFDHKQIEKIYHLGLLDDEEEKELKLKLKSDNTEN